MSKAFNFFLPIEPKPKLRPRFDPRGHAFTPEATRRYERDLRLLIQEKCSQGQFCASDKALELAVDFNLTKPKSVKRTYPSVKPDCDNLLKAFCDAANGLLWVDDALIISVKATKYYCFDPAKAGIGVFLREIEQTPARRGEGVRDGV